MSSPHRFVVRRQVYTPADGNGVRRLLPEKHDRVATFPKADAAFADCATRLAEFRRTTNPFQLGGPCLFYQTNLPAFAFHDYLLDHNITPPPTSLTANPNYVFWWVKNNRTFTDRDREVVWTACDKLKPFDVIEEDDRNAVFMVVELCFSQWLETWFVIQEGGAVFSAHPRMRDARRIAQERHQLIRGEFGERILTMSDGTDVVSEEVNAFATVETVPLLEPATGGTSVSLLVRQSYWSANGGYAFTDDARCYNAGARVAIAASCNPSVTCDERSSRMRVARRTVNPVSLLWHEYLDPDALYDADDDDRLPNGMTFEEAWEIVRKLPTIPPAPEVLTAEWYDRVVQWSPELIDVIWSTFADFRLFEVIEVPLG